MFLNYYENTILFIITNNLPLSFEVTAAKTSKKGKEKPSPLSFAILVKLPMSRVDLGKNIALSTTSDLIGQLI